MLWMLVANLVSLSPAVGWSAGASRVTITPNEPVWMAGYASRTQPGQQKASELYARGLALRDAGGNTGLLIALDLVGIDGETAGRWAAEIGKEHRLPRKSIVLACSHTHCGPVVGATLRDMYPVTEADKQAGTRYQGFLQERIFLAARQAMANLAPATLTWYRGTCDFAVNRRNNPEPEVEKLRAAGTLKGPVDHSVPVLAIRDHQGKSRAILFGYACHATTMGFQQWYGDWPGEACAALEKDMREQRGDEAGVAVFVAGCGADQNPLPRRRMELAIAYGNRLADSVKAAMDGKGPAVQGKLGMALDMADLPLETPPGRDTLLDQRMSMDKAVSARARRLLALLDSGSPLPTRYAAPVQAWSVGDARGLVFLPGEVVVDYALRLPGELPGRQWWIGSYANDVMAYIPSRRVRREGGYEGEKAMVYYGLPAPWREEVEEVLVGAVKRVAAQSLANIGTENPPSPGAGPQETPHFSKKKHFFRFRERNALPLARKGG